MYKRQGLLTAARLDGNLLDASLVTAAFEIGGEELFDEFHCLVVGDETDVYKRQS